MLNFPQGRPVDPLLTDFANDIAQNGGVKLQDVIFPVKRTKGETGTYFEFDANSKFRNYVDYRADGAEANAIEWKATKATFAQEEYALKADVTDRERENSILPLSLDQEAAQLVTDSLALNREIRTRDLVFPTGLSPEVTVSAKWDQNTSTIALLDNENIKQSFQKKVGQAPNAMIIPKNVWKYFIDPSLGANTIGGIIHDKVKYSSRVNGLDVTTDAIAQLFGVERVYVPDMIFTDTPLTATVAAAGAGVTAGGFIWDTLADNTTVNKHIAYVYVNPGAGFKSLTTGWTFQSQPYTIFRYREEKLRKDWVEGSRVEDVKITAAACMLRARVLT